MANPVAHLEKFTDHWTSLEYMPDLDMVVYKNPKLRYWEDKKTRTGKQKNRYAEHRFLDKLCRPWANSSYDFCIMMNLWPLIYMVLNEKNEEEEVDMTTEFAAGFWGCYVGYMEARPSLHSDEAQDVYKYILSNIPLLVAGWRARIYYYSSASIFKEVMTPLQV